ncbi:hypothetical protein JJJ17_13320 [Paracoccus caeni]|uniref:Uncharacterized protein n=2 Tax=Paracoccus caeni TaxID=657651 RepID=A0A934SM72_9RHOB|nr:hypothetical protein [Paracoccus caeni]
MTRLDNALASIDGATEQFRLSAEMTVQPHARLFWDLAAAAFDLRAQVERNPGNITAMRRFLLFYLPTMAELCLRWARLSHADPLRPPDETAIADFRNWLDITRAAAEACRARSHDDLRLTMEALDDQLQRLSI